MNFNEEIEQEIKSLGLNAKVVPVPEELRPTPRDWVLLEQNIALRIHENEIMLTQSELNAARSTLC